MFMILGGIKLQAAVVSGHFGDPKPPWIKILVGDLGAIKFAKG